MKITPIAHKFNVDVAEACRLACKVSRNSGLAYGTPWHVCPVKLAPNDGKMPTPPRINGEPRTGGYKRASSCPAEIVTLFDLYPAPLIGVATGACSGVDVLDFDTTKHENAQRYYNEISRYGWTNTRTYRTRSGGLHCYYLHAVGVGCSTGKLAEGVDVRGDGGGAVFWFADGYPCENHVAPQPWPAELLEIHGYRKPNYEPPTSFAASPDKAVAAIIDKMHAAAAGGRNGLLYWSAHRLIEHDAWAEHWQALRAAAIASGLDRHEVDATLTSVRRARHG
jgi:hypothetical protein